MTTFSTTGEGASLTSVSLGRKVKDRSIQGLVYLAFALAVVPLVAVLWTVVVNGLERLDPTFFQFSMNAVSGSDPGGGAYHAIVGTLQQVAICSAIAVPLSILTAIYLVEYAGGGRLGKIISFTVDVMMGIPSIVAACSSSRCGC